MNLKLDDFLYELPADKIAKHPLENRSDSKLLFYDRGNISHYLFKQISDLIPANSLLVFNDTKVIPARIVLHKETGARIEIFLLEPLLPSRVHEEMMNTTGSCTWRCMVGNAKKWKSGASLFYSQLGLKATRVNEDQVRFEWGASTTFSDLLTKIGKIPLPPYISREVEEADEYRYQTVYSKVKGAVAAPTAGLHFTENIISDLQQEGIKTDYITLHVSAGTFQPIKGQNISEHTMHNEQIWVTKKNVENLIQERNIITVGTTAMRTIESLYWFGIKLLNGQTEFFITKEDVYLLKPISKNESLEAVLSFMNSKKINKLGGQTEIFIYPGYTFRLCRGLVTNYHLPGSTLILLVAAFAGKDWKRIYREALQNNYRFLSYGDCSLLMHSEE